MKTRIVLLLIVSSVLANETTLKEFISGNNLFAASIYKAMLNNTKDNFLVSPLSAEIILSLAQSGAKDETAQEIQNSLHLPNSKEKIESAIQALLPSLDSPHYFFRSANKLYIKDNYRINDEFKNITSSVYGAAVEKIDFTHRTEAANTINKWVEEQTSNKIHDLLDPQLLNDTTRALLLNALYFQGNWSNQFQLFFTAKRLFYAATNNIVHVETMHDFEVFYNYYESPELDAKFLELPFEGDGASMVIVLSNDKEGLSNLEKRIDEVLVTPNFTKQLINVALPKFKIENQIDCKEILKGLGVNKAFQAKEADFSGIAGAKGDLFISEVIQKSFIEVDEEGVEAAAATLIIKLFPRVGIPAGVVPKDFVADHPFIFYIKVKDVIVFVGRVLMPNY